VAQPGLLAEMKKDVVAGTSPAMTSRNVSDPTLLQCFQIFDEVSLCLQRRPSWNTEL
jgi:hypothetical protein